MNKKRAWLLVRGLVRSYKHWGEFPQHLQKMAPEDLIIYVDLPGNGESFHEQSPLSIAENARKVRAQALVKSKGHDLYVIAISMGAMVVVEWMKNFHGDINQAFFINTSSNGLSAPLERFQVKNILKYFLESKFTDRETNILKVSSNNIEKAKIYAPIFEQEAKEHPVSSANAIKQIFAAGIYSFPPQMPGTVHLIASEHDRLVKVSCSRAIAKMWNLPLTTHPTAGHDLPMDEPQWLAEKILELSSTKLPADR